MINKMKLKRDALLTLTAAIIGVGTVFYHFIEGFSWVDAFYFTVITLTTVGYGDIYPVTDVGKLFTAFYVIVGLGILLAFISFVSESIIERRVIRRQNKTKQKRSK